MYVFSFVCYLRSVVRGNVVITSSEYEWLLVSIMLFRSHARSYVFTCLGLILILLATYTHTTTSIFHRHVQAQPPQPPIILVLTPTSSRFYTSLLLANPPIQIHALPPPNATLLDDRAYPQGTHRHLSAAARSAWRAHMNAMQHIIEQGLATALVVSGDVAWGEGLLERVQAGEWDVVVLGNTTHSFVYGVTQAGARKVVYEHGMRNFDREFGTALGEWCRGETRNMGQRPRCVDSGSGKVFDM